MSAPEHMTQQLDVALAEYTPGIDSAARFVTIDQVDMLAEFYLHNRATQPAPRDEVIAELVEALDRVLAWHDKDKHTVGEMSFERSGAFSRARTALAAAKAVQP